MKLEHLAPYLPYKLKLLYTHANKIGTLSNVYTIGEGYDDDDTKISVDHYDGEHLWMFKPILRPLSDLTKEIQHNGETFVPAIEISRDLCCSYPGELKILDDTRDNYIVIGTRIAGRIYDLKKKIDRLEFWQVQKLISWHFDVFGLIEKGEAVDINTI